MARPVAHGGGTQPVLFQVARQQAADVGVVVDDEDVVGSVHGLVHSRYCTSAAARSGRHNVSQHVEPRLEARRDKKGLAATHRAYTAALQWEPLHRGSWQRPGPRAWPDSHPFEEHIMKTTTQSRPSRWPR